MKRTYRVGEMDWPGENTGENPQPLRIRRINARLLIEGDDDTDMDLLPLMRIVHGSAEQAEKPTPDPAYAPPCMILRASAGLLCEVRDMANLLDVTRKEQAEQLIRAAFQEEILHGGDLVSLLHAQVLCRYSAVLPHLLEAPSVMPFQVYLLLRQLLAELSALNPGKDVFEVAGYDHDNPLPCFREILRRIRVLVRPGKDRFVKVPFAVADEGTFAAQLSPDHFTVPIDYFLGIRSRKASTDVVALAHDKDRFRLLPKSKQRLAIFGVPLEVEYAPPPVLPLERGLQYFRIKPDERRNLWADMKSEGAMVVVGPPADTSDFQITLYMIMPKMEGAGA